MIPEPVQRLANGVVQCMVILANCILFSLYHGVLRKRRVLKRKILNPTTKICFSYLALASSLQYCPKLFLSSSLLACYSLFTKGKSLTFPAHLMPSNDEEFPRTVPVAQERLHYFPQQELFLSLKVQLLQCFCPLAKRNLSQRELSDLIFLLINQPQSILFTLD